MQRRLRWISATFGAFMAASPVCVGAVDCKNAITQMDMDQCDGMRNKQLEQELNRTYRAVMSQLSPEARMQLRAEQRVWLKERDTTCERVWKDGAWDKPIWERIECESYMTRQRADVLRKWQAK